MSKNFEIELAVFDDCVNRVVQAEQPLIIGVDKHVEVVCPAYPAGSKIQGKSFDARDVKRSDSGRAVIAWSLGCVECPYPQLPFTRVAKTYEENGQRVTELRFEPVQPEG